MIGAPGASAVRLDTSSTYRGSTSSATTSPEGPTRSASQDAYAPSPLATSKTFIPGPIGSTAIIDRSSAANARW